MLLGKTYLEWWSVRRVHPTHSATQSSLWPLTHGKMHGVYQLSRSGWTELSSVVHKSASDRDSRVHKLHCSLLTLSCHSTPSTSYQDHQGVRLRTYKAARLCCTGRTSWSVQSWGSRGPGMRFWEICIGEWWLRDSQSPWCWDSDVGSLHRGVGRQPLRKAGCMADTEHWNSKVQDRIFRIHTTFSRATCIHDMVPLTSCYPFATCPGENGSHWTPIWSEPRATQGCDVYFSC